MILAEVVFHFNGKPSRIPVLLTPVAELYLKENNIGLQMERDNLGVNNLLEFGRNICNLLSKLLNMTISLF